MARVRGLLIGFVLVMVAWATPSTATAAYASQAAAYAACLSDPGNGGYSGREKCYFHGSSPMSPAGDATCPSGFNSDSTQYYMGLSTNWPTDVVGHNFLWCVPASCPSGTSPGGQSDYAMNDPGALMSGGGVVDQGGCCATLSFTQSSWSAPDKSDAVSVGHFVLNGNRCYSTLGGATTGDASGGRIPNPPPLIPYNHCKAGVASCYNPFDDNFCAQSQSGEWFCVPRKTPDPGGCISGATGAACLGKDGNPVPPPPDPPIKNGTPPDTTNNYTINDAGTTNNYTTNNYSGTSAGGSGSESPAPGSSSPGGTGSNTGGSGNTGKNGTDANGNCPNGSKPTASGCSGTYRDDGCDTPPACFGDAVLCGIAANTHKSACAASGSSIGSPPTGLDGDPTDNTGDPTSSAVSSSVDLGDATGSLDGSGFGYSSTCPLQDINFSVMGSSVSIPLADKCDLLSFLKYIVLALAYFMAAKIIAGVK